MELSNKQIVDVLLALKTINLERSTLLDKSPLPLPNNLSWDNVEGMLLGLAIGDALGNTSESKSPEFRRTHFRLIRNYLPNARAGGERIGMPSDDTQMAFWTIEQMLKDGKFVPENIAEIFADNDVFHGGKTCREFRENYNNGVHWFLAGPQSAGNGAIMRIAPMILPYLKRPSAELWADTILSAMITHNDRASTGSCVALNYIIWEMLRLGTTFDGDAPYDGWFKDTFCNILKKFEGVNTAYTPRDGSNSYSGPLWKYIKEMDFEEFELEEIKSGAYMPGNYASYYLYT